uniref:Cysteine protease n=1 Tax=Panagrolaimus sp. PS1159 TaxID=55785 RepID=A0AC35FY84_9BILA
MEQLQAIHHTVMETYFSLEAGFTDIDNASIIERAEVVHLLGQEFSSKEIDAIKEFSTSLIWFTYRKNFPAIGGTGPTSDQGWGCMLRCGQMLLAQALAKLHLESSWKWERNSNDEKYRRLLRMFQDKRTSLFSLHQIAQMGVSEKKALGEWFGPNTIAQVLKKLVVYDDWSKIAIHVAMDNILISSDVREMARAKPPCKELSDISSNNQQENEKEQNGHTEEDLWKPLLIIVPLRLGLTVMNRCYLKAIQEYFKLPQCVGIIGGRPNHAVYFYGVAKDKLLYLDPHVCQDSVTVDKDPMEAIPSDPASTILSSCQSNTSQVSMEYVDNPANGVTSETSSPELGKSAASYEYPSPSTPPAIPNPSSPIPDSFDDSSFHCPYLMHMDFDSLDPSLALSFLCKTEEDYNDLVKRLPSMISASSPPLFELLEKRPKGFPKFVPYVGEDDALKLKEFDDFGDPTFNSDEEFEVLM